MKVKIIRVDKTLPLPEYKTEGSVAFDLYSRIDAAIKPREVVVLPSNLIIEVPPGHALILASRSSLAQKKGLVLRNAIGVIDMDYHGPKDEIGLQVYNFTEQPVMIERGERLMQGLIVPIVRAEWEEVGQIKDSSRGGFGSTG
ncbi:MAG: dUTPase [Candidatus Doudnabacteria bacterium RIFCSPHIGHO2_01_FULL_50_11]|uniref:dUTP diphosphatase n=1 Tax=Candidatus Doudnabacteria bacterium RIFCSPHIGHO2_01_FULL_50_11 TaxID=1817828 RepID=A0A1F5PM14_9BACT|nr:MAG: dUTPase [Candidatus Doudnabacteria bacterium RIFCSPHIGHO2_01_FULL_50_11]HLC44337.1 dUTP diphosphatase [Patescibacteria group bacterium]